MEERIGTGYIAIGYCPKLTNSFRKRMILDELPGKPFLIGQKCGNERNGSFSGQIEVLGVRCDGCDIEVVQILNVFQWDKFNRVATPAASFGKEKEGLFLGIIKPIQFEGYQSNAPKRTRKCTKGVITVRGIDELRGDNHSHGTTLPKKLQSMEKKRCPRGSELS
jgi:hypothetical protein